MATGTIKRIARDKGFGFIRDNSGQEYFFHRSSVQGSFDSLSEGQRVSFDEEQSPKGPRAGNVRPDSSQLQGRWMQLSPCELRGT
jgi:CspA family cold shock protein